MNLMTGLDRIGVPYRVNDYRHMRANPDELSCVVGKPHILRAFPPAVPLLFGPSIYNHPIDDEHLPERHNVRQVLVPSPWVQKMYSAFWPGLVTVWPVGIDVDRWKPAPSIRKDVDVLIYDKIFRDREGVLQTIVNPLQEEFHRRGLVVAHLRYGSYFERQLLSLTRRIRALVYLSRHETQGIALQQTLASDVPVFAFDPGGDWQSPEYRARGVQFGPVTSVPYWDDRCGVRFSNAAEMLEAFDGFWKAVEAGAYSPRQFIMNNNLTLEDSAQAYANFARQYSG